MLEVTPNVEQHLGHAANGQRTFRRAPHDVALGNRVQRPGVVCVPAGRAAFAVYRVEARAQVAEQGLHFVARLSVAFINIIAQQLDECASRSVKCPARARTPHFTAVKHRQQLR